TIVSIKNDGHYFCRAGGNRPDGLNEPVTISRLTVKHIFCGGVVVLALFYLFYLLRLDSQTQDILHQLNKLLR
ncbi:hypothetical protein SNB35_19475, partial [Escherichia coli]|nr:hypothetical protein [Escherichia coli]